jgi:DNA-3-methyladenine glycosylase II|tara:strand:- start:435 stop:1046 length:612 start_codon:yes stop_codon:yes gene_type:complete
MEHKKAFEFLYKKAVQKKYKNLANHIKKVGPLKIKLSNMDFVDHLSKIIVGQQLSVASAAAIWARTEILLNKNKYKKINNNLNIKFKNAGLSRQKIEYLNGIIFDEKIQNLTKNDLQRMSHSDFYEFLIKIKGIGPWSIEMSRIFYVGDADVFSILDLGLKNAHIRMFDLESYNEDFYKEFSPYRSYMCLYMWRVLEDENVTI